MLYNIKGRYYVIQKRRNKMSLILNVQLSAFSNYRIEPTANNVTFLMESINKLGIKEFLPNITTGQNIDLIKGKLETISNLGFVTSDKTGQIICQNNRIDCMLNYGEDNQCEINESIDALKQIILLILKEFDILSNRLALNVNILSDVYEGDLKGTKFGRKLVSTLDFYKDKELSEWSTRKNVRYPIKICDKEEILNVITEFSKVTRNPGEENRILCHMDINTIPENTGYRFNYEKMDSFVENIKDIVNDIKTNFEELSNHDQ